VVSTSQDGLDNQRRGYLFRGGMAGIVVVLMITSVVTPHLMVVAATEFAGRSLIPVSRFFLLAQAGAEGFAGGVSLPAVAFAINVSYFGLALQQIGLLTGVASVWVLVSEDVGRWMRRLVMVSGVTLVMGASTTVMGYLLLNNAGIPAVLGIAWLPTLVAGILMLLGGMNAKKRLVSTWFWERPDVVQP
jgi:hypothetical protein